MADLAGAELLLDFFLWILLLAGVGAALFLHTPLPERFLGITLGCASGEVCGELC